MKLPKASPDGLARIDVEIRILDEPFVVDLRLLSAGEESEALVEAYAYAKSRGVGEPDESSALYERGYEMAIVSRALVDHDSPKGAPERLFESLEALEEYSLLTSEHIAYLKARYDDLVDEKSPRTLVVSTEAFVEIRRRSADGDPRPFSKLRRGAQWSCFHTMAVLCETLLEERSRSSSPSPPTPPTTPTEH